MKKSFVLVLAVLASLFSIDSLGQIFVSEANITISNKTLGEVRLPYFYEGGRTSLQSVNAKYILPPLSIGEEKVYAILIPYPVQGGGVYINGKLIYELESSTDERFFNWYRPILINVSARDFNFKSSNLLEFRQVGHLRGWVVLPVVWGVISDLRPIYETLFYLSQTLVETINFLCAFVGLFLVLIGLLGKESKYIYPGLAALVWVILFKLALLSNFSSASWFVWRLSLYFFTGNLILLSTLFMINFFSVEFSRKNVMFFSLFCQLGWLIFFLVGAPSEYYLDIYWTGGAVFAYIVCVVYTFCARTNMNLIFAILFSLYLCISSVFALHDFSIQAGFLFDFKDDLFNVIGNAIYLSHFSLPAFMLTACILLSIDYLRNKNNLISAIKENLNIRDEIVSDIHDGVGARLNVLLMGLEIKALEVDAIKEDVRRCIDELRFVLVSKDEKTPFLLKLIVDFCSDISLKFSKKNIKFDYIIESDSISNLSPKLALVLYFSTLECLNNIIKHATTTAKYVNYSLSVTPNVAHLVVEDDGPGIDGWSNSEQRFMAADFKIGLGIKSMISRVTASGGAILIVTKPYESTAISISFEI